LILAREIGITIFRLAVIKGGVIPANRGGKIKSTFQSFGVGFFMLPMPESLYWFRDGFIAIAIVLTIVTGANYVRLAIRKP
jgi:CDP-diacylglycerol--glycerol-3-phosphate 3-phosphatidyltransferase